MSLQTLKIKTIILKEWAEVFRNRLVLFSVIFLPMILTALPLVILYSIGRESSLNNVDTDMPAQFTALCPAELNAGECMQVFMVSQFMLMFMILPLAIPSSIAAYSIVGEKVNRSLEPILATPISTVELLAGKSLAALIPAILVTYVAFGVFAIGARLLASSPVMVAALLDARWLLAVLLVGPLMALMAVNFTVIVSSRVSDPRVAEQLAMLIILPVLGIFFGQMAGLFLINRQFVIAAAGILILIDGLLVFAAVTLFDRETILTRWK